MPTDPRDYKLELSTGSQAPADAGASSRPYLSVLFNCCKVYQRIYLAPSGEEYRGRCPKCGKPVRFVVGEGGTSARFFTVE